jgi:hypothetical protein
VACTALTSKLRVDGVKIKQESPRQHTAVRVDEAMHARIEAVRKTLSTTWRDATVSDVLRLLIYRGLETMEQQHHAGLKKTPHNPKAPRSKI